VSETDACFIVKATTRQGLAYVYCEEEPGHALLLTYQPNSSVVQKSAISVCERLV
jgi:hypothetical protein